MTVLCSGYHASHVKSDMINIITLPVSTFKINKKNKKVTKLKQPETNLTEIIKVLAVKI